ncbi:50S ribosomal protein L25 [Anaerococcus sp. AGMB00486]|uniref:Large ribosomal subunit protein bL25 n=2 Tax=Anaerococcus TaxID=165779 RepID=A0ABX2N6Y1_9FIRM|nr:MULTISPECIES: 50S ribosomal protein L25 [Anaerococcus]MDY3005999.1 50S ribosomal protein L25 [Anaerococcus porci]MSS77066.1 50S ribosomal protein L25 [Anaerococcus porci]NVF10444.1 50S ribosomal protein L25 [Anaerococcus faecalis]
MADIVLEAKKRDAVGKNKVNKLRQQAIVPGVVYAKDKDNVNVQFTSRDFEKVLSQAGTSTIIDLNIDGEKVAVLIKDYQMHPFKSQFFHVDFQAINAKESIRVNVPVYLNGRDDIRVEPSVLVQNIDTVEVECLPMYIPQYAELEVAEMQIGDSFTVADLDIAKDNNITILLEDDEVICSLQEPQEEVIEDEEEANSDAADVPTVNETEEKENEE